MTRRSAPRFLRAGRSAGQSRRFRWPSAASTTETATITPPANAPLNSTQNVTLTYGQGVTSNTVSVLDVTPNPSTVEADTQVEVSADVLAGVTQPEQGTVSYTVTNSQAGSSSRPRRRPSRCRTVIGVTNVDLGTLDTTGLSPGTYTINVSVSDSTGTPIPGATGEGELFVGRPITATQSLSSNTLAPDKRHGHQHAFDRRPGTTWVWSPRTAWGQAW